MNIRVRLIIILGLLSISTWSGCRSTEMPFEKFSGGKPLLTASVFADIIIVEKGPPRLSQVQPIPSHIVLPPGETIAFSAISFDQRGREIKDVTFSWQVVDSRAGTITPSGVFRTGLTLGTFDDALVVTARASSGSGGGLLQATASVIVAEFKGQLQPASVRVFPETAEVEPRETLRLLALAVDTNGVAIPNKKFKWEILEPRAGSISHDGRLTASVNIGTFPGAIRVTLAAEEGDMGERISTRLDVHVVDPEDVAQRMSGRVLPQVISLRPEEQMRFITMVLDRRGNQIPPVDTHWEVLDPKTGFISQDGRFTADSAGVFSWPTLSLEESIRVYLPGAEVGHAPPEEDIRKKHPVFVEGHCSKLCPFSTCQGYRLRGNLYTRQYVPDDQGGGNLVDHRPGFGLQGYHSNNGPFVDAGEIVSRDGDETGDLTYFGGVSGTSERWYRTSPVYHHPDQIPRHGSIHLERAPPVPGK